MHAEKASAAACSPNEHWNVVPVSFEVKPKVAVELASGLAGFCVSVTTGGVVSMVNRNEADSGRMERRPRRAERQRLVGKAESLNLPKTPWADTYPRLRTTYPPAQHVRAATATQRPSGGCRGKLLLDREASVLEQAVGNSPRGELSP